MSKTDFVSGLPYDVELLGGFRTRLTNSEFNAWTEFLRAVPEYTALRETKIEQRLAWAMLGSGSGDGGDGDTAIRFLNLSKKINQLEDAIYSISKAWCAKVAAERDEKDAVK